ncbi:MAG: gliding motility lipoprotein GldB [Bacteroidetes bacterium]|nr:gliding motility lipoprotein GldB [Bacteroidota bacterium]
MRFLIFFSVLFITISCSSDKSNVKKEVESIPMEVEFLRFDKAFAEAEPEDLPELKAEFPEFFPVHYADSVWINKMQDTLQIELEREVFKVFPDKEPLLSEIVLLFKHIKYYFPKFDPPKIVTTTSDVDYRHSVIATDSILVIGLDNYLGTDHYFYGGIERYFAKVMHPEHVISDIAEAYAEKYVRGPRKNVFMDHAVYYGKILYLKDLWLPDSPDALKIGYTEEEYQWAEENEVYMWQYFVEQEILFSSDSRLPARFFNPAPFSKFYLEIDNESPGMLGRYLGWKIVRSYMKNNKVSVQELMVTDAEELFRNSKYKPRK